ncbi:MAG: hypothetical protein DME43_08190 [Verrucomicrobia bacterium]|nr:MAG: hypothetical protein DME43_08190 [Verrucomicrobiota bacterium]
MAYQPTKKLLRPKVGLDEARKSLALKANKALAWIKEPNSNFPTKCSHYISHLPCPLHLFTIFQLFTRSILRAVRFCLTLRQAPQLFQPAIISH